MDQDYELDREIVALNESARTESVWVRTRAYEGSAARPLVAEMILSKAVMEASYPRYDGEARELGRLTGHTEATPRAKRFEVALASAKRGFKLR